MTTRARSTIFLAAMPVVSPALLTLFDVGPMGYHSGTALLVRVVALLLATASLAGVFAIAGYLYWLHVVSPAPAPAHERATGYARSRKTGSGVPSSALQQA